ncbi:DUF2933 domain-containing protein [Candidatus Formimonas warabiya]|uniref:DUF2933 domain-containing protein n=1 Tax=Formimonas warabiya TaxID=1761012 RepID=A0A3G1KZT7_FORW1|nr:DUF2933 domain-containing protein [Candidatus Formimonas warabiya]ATW28042.1 hypothetical protein DCMF_27755 [Candidatus Formimonas warabiya]
MDHKKGFLHSLLMMACCILPMLGLILLAPQLKAAATKFDYSWLFLLACPLVHLFMMRGMRGKGESCHGEGKQDKVQGQ